MQEYGIADGVCEFEILDNSNFITQTVKDRVVAASTVMAGGKVVVPKDLIHK